MSNCFQQRQRDGPAFPLSSVPVVAQAASGWARSPAAGLPGHCSTSWWRLCYFLLLLRERWGVSTPPADRAEHTGQLLGIAERTGGGTAAPFSRGGYPSLWDGSGKDFILPESSYSFFFAWHLCLSITKECLKLNLSGTAAQQELTQFNSCTLLQHLSGEKPTPLPRGLFGKMSVS